MCTPTLSLAMTVVGGITSFLGEVQAGQAQQAQLQHQAQIAHNNALVAQNNQVTAMNLAEDARLRGEADATQFSAQVRRERGRQIAALAANGVVVDAGSAFELTSEAGELGQLDALTIRSNAEREALGFDSQASNFGAEINNQNASAQNFTIAGNNAARAANGRAFGSLLTSAGGVAGKWFQFGNAGLV